jgi:nucleotidyltransferase/DNA polymerase involved in DNA repair
VEDLVIEEADVIVERTGLSRKKVEKMQATAQLLMIPGINEKTVKLLQKAGITSVDKLASENPIQLFRKVASVAKNSDDRPTLEEIASYTSFARSNFGVFH